MIKLGPVVEVAVILVIVFFESDPISLDTELA